MKTSRILIAAVAGVALLLPATPALAGKAASSPVMVDAWIATGNSGHTGVGVLSRTGVGESLASSVAAPTTLIYDVGAMATGGSTTVTFMGGGGSPDFIVRYYAADGADVTLAVTGRGYTVRRVADGTTAHLKMVVQVQRSAAGHSGNLAVLASSSSGGDMVMGFVTAS